MANPYYSCNNNQNYFIQNNRSTSRVLQPPGGSSTLSIGLGKGPSSSFLSPEHKHKRTSAKVHKEEDKMARFSNVDYQSVELANENGAQSENDRFMERNNESSRAYGAYSNSGKYNNSNSNSNSNSNVNNNYNYKNSNNKSVGNGGRYQDYDNNDYGEYGDGGDDKYGLGVKSEPSPIRYEIRDRDYGGNNFEHRHEEQSQGTRHYAYDDNQRYRSPSKQVASDSLPVINSPNKNYNQSYNSNNSNSNSNGSSSSNNSNYEILRQSAEDAIYNEYLMQKSVEDELSNAYKKNKIHSSMSSSPSKYLSPLSNNVAMVTISPNTKGKGTMDPTLYASLLRQQIEEKSRYDEEIAYHSNRVSFIHKSNENIDESIFGGRNRNKNRNQTYEYKASSNDNNYTKNVKYSKNSGSPSRNIIPSIKVHAPPGGQSSLSLGWDN